MAIRGNTSAGAQMAPAVAMHLPTDFPACPTGTDRKSAAIAAAVESFVSAARAEAETFNFSVDQLRDGMVAAPQRVEATDQQGAKDITSSGTVTV